MDKLAKVDRRKEIRNLEATLELVSHERNNLRETCSKLDISIAEQAKEIEQLRLQLKLSQSKNWELAMDNASIKITLEQSDAVRSERDKLRRQLAEVS